MSRSVPSDLTLEGLKKEAKRWLRALDANDADARDRLVRALTNPPPVPTLRTVQLALARELGFEGWAALKRAIPTQLADRSLDEAVTLFLDNACPDHHVRGGSDHVRAEHTAMRLLARRPEIATANFYTAVVCGDLDAVNRALTADPGWATRPSTDARHALRDVEGRKNAEPDPGRTGLGSEGDLTKRDWGAKGWQPLSYLCFTRLPLPSVTDNAVAIARALLEHGADPNVYFMAGGCQYTPLTGVIGEGEEGRRGHPKRDELVRLLLESGAHLMTYR